MVQLSKVLLKPRPDLGLSCPPTCCPPAPDTLVCQPARARVSPDRTNLGRMLDFVWMPSNVWPMPTTAAGDLAPRLRYLNHTPLTYMVWGFTRDDGGICAQVDGPDLELALELVWRTNPMIVEVFAWDRVTDSKLIAVQERI